MTISDIFDFDRSSTSYWPQEDQSAIMPWIQNIENIQSENKVFPDHINNLYFLDYCFDLVIEI